MVRLVVFDMDGILLMFDYYLGEKIFFILARLRERDIIFIFVTGRYALEM